MQLTANAPTIALLIIGIGVLAAPCCPAAPPATAAATAAARPTTAPDAAAGTASSSATSLAGDPAIKALIAKAEQTGTVRVIAMVKAPQTPATEMTEAQEKQYNRQLKSIQNRVLQRVLAGAKADQVTCFEITPAISLFATAAQLRRLAADPDVVSIQEDTPTPLPDGEDSLSPD